MRFEALPVNNGDAFLIAHGNDRILIDGGMDQRNIVKLLKYKSRLPKRHVNLLVGTHYHKDHINGLLGIISSDVGYDEIWLPSIYGSIAKTVAKKFPEVIKWFSEQWVSDKKVDLKEFLHEDASLEKVYEEVDTDPLFYFFNWPYFLPVWMSTNENFRLLATARKICLLTAISIDSAYIRWMGYRNQVTNNPYGGYDLYLQNGEQEGVSIYTREQLLTALYCLHQINKESLVYKWEKAGLPNILFTSDSDLGFQPNKFTLKNDSIVTAPHHGSANNDVAYRKIHGKGLIYVRSNHYRVKLNGYLLQKQCHWCYCVNCRNKGPAQSVRFVWQATNWSIKGKKCSC